MSVREAREQLPSGLERAARGEHLTVTERGRLSGRCLAAMQRAGHSNITLVIADLRQAQAARSLGWSVLGA